MAAAMLRELFHPRAMADFPGPFASRARQVVEELRQDWERTSREAAENRRIDELHAIREDYHSLLNGHLNLLEHYLTLAKLHHHLFGSNPLWTEELGRAISELTKLHDDLFPRWQTAQDLTQLLIEKFTLPSEKLRELVAKNPPPQSWYEETIDPFAAE
jgi:hypothetical protein